MTGTPCPKEQEEHNCTGFRKIRKVEIEKKEKTSTKERTLASIPAPRKYGAEKKKGLFDRLRRNGN